MHCVIICAGKGTRMRPLTETTPKPLLHVCGKPILQHIVEALPKEITELILVVGYLKEQIEAFCKEEFLGKKVTYVTQENFAGGTGDALMCAKQLLRGKFLFMYADDIHGREALAKVVQEEYAMLGMHSNTPERFGVIEQHKDGTLKQIVEKPEHPTSHMVNIGGFVLDESIFSYAVPVSSFGELLVTDMVNAFAQDHAVKIIEQTLWLPIGYPEQITDAEAVLCSAQID